jgi:hypothetical protein
MTATSDGQGGEPGDRRRAVLWVAAGSGLLLFALSTLTSADSDLWGHLRFGLDTLHTHVLTAVDPYSFTQDRSWINHEWLSELQMALAYTAAGSAGLALLKGALVFGTMLLVWSALAGVDLSARIVILGVTALSTVPATRTLRPQLWSMLCLAIVCRVLIDERASLRRWLPALFAVWANLHGGWIVGLGILVAWAMADIWSRPRELWSWLWIIPASAGATLVNPYGWALWRFLSTTVGMDRQITEWRPLWTATAPNWVPWIVVSVATVWILRSSTARRLPVAVVLAALAYASLRVMRIWPLYVECAAILLAPQVRARWPLRSPLSAQIGKDFKAAVGVSAVAFALAAYTFSVSLRCVGVDGDWGPDQVAAYALSGATPGRLVVFFDWGEYALWHWGPGLRVSMDGRRETVYSDRRLDEHGAILAGSPAGIAALASWRAEYAWLPATSIRTREWLATHGYRIEVVTAKSFVAVRNDLPALAVSPSSSPSAGARRCFPD